MTDHVTCVDHPHCFLRATGLMHNELDPKSQTVNYKLCLDNFAASKNSSMKEVTEF
jgi:hypothetical protein